MVSTWPPSVNWRGMQYRLYGVYANERDARKYANMLQTIEGDLVKVAGPAAVVGGVEWAVYVWSAI